MSGEIHNRIHEFVSDILRQARGWEPQNQNEVVLAAKQVCDVADAIVPVIVSALASGATAVQQRPKEQG